MISYIILIATIVFVIVFDKAIYSKPQKKIVLSNSLYIIVALAITLFAGLRHGIGYDYYQYYYTITTNLETNIVSRGEILTEWLVEISRNLSSTTTYFLINAIITTSLISATISRYSSDKWLSLYMFLCFPLFFLNSLSVVRFFAATSIIFYGSRYIEKNNLLLYFATCLIASSMHGSAIIALLLYPFSKIKPSITTVFGIIILGISLSNIANHLSVEYLPQYADYTQATTVREGTLAIYFFIFIFLISLFCIKKISEDLITSKFYLCYVFGVTIYISFYGQGTMSHRLSLFGTIYSMILLPQIINFIFTNKMLNLYIKVIFYVILTAGFLYSLAIGKETYFPYKTIFSI